MTLPPAASEARWRWSVIAACVLLSMLAFAPVFKNGFIESFDDGEHITKNGWVRLGLSWEGVRWALAPGGQGEQYWHPLTWLSLMADVQLFGMRPGPIHAENLALHIVSSVLLLLALHRMTGGRWRSAAVALLFAVHPLQVESVAWAVERKTVLASALGMGALLAYAWYAERPSWRRYLAALGLFASSFLAKPTFAMLPFLLLLLDVWPLGRTSLASAERTGSEVRPAAWPRLVAEKVPFLVLALCGVLLVGRSITSIVEDVPLSLRGANALTSTWEYLGKLVWPSRLAVYYPNPPAIPAWKTAAAGMGVVAASTLVVVARRRLSFGAIVGWCWFLGTLLPVSGIVRRGLWPAMADRFMYLPIVGALICVVWGAGALAERAPRARIALAAALGAALAASAVRSHHQAHCWESSLTLFRNAVEATPPSRFVWSNYGTLLQADGRTAEARAWWEEMIRTLPDAPDGYLNLGAMWHASGDLARAEAAYRVALEKDPRCGHAHYNLALLHKKKGSLALALAGFAEAKATGLRAGPVLEHIGTLAAALGRPAEAEDAFAEAFRADPLNWRAGVGLARLMAGRGRSTEAQAILRETWLRAERAGEAEAAREAGVADAP